MGDLKLNIQASESQDFKSKTRAVLFEVAVKPFYADN
jgi:hypothetical protein